MGRDNECQSTVAGWFARALLATLVLCCLGGGICLASDSVEGEAALTFNPISARCDWQPQDYFDSRAISKVMYDPRRSQLRAYGRFMGGDDHNSKGEVYLDLRFVPELEDTLPLDLSASTITVDIAVPRGFQHKYIPNQPEIPNIIQVFFKDSQWRCLYSQCQNTLRYNLNGSYLLEYSFPSSIPGYMDAGFDASQVIVMGVKFAIGGGSKQKCSGSFVVKGFQINPAVNVDMPPTPQEPFPPVFRRSDRVTARDGALWVGSKEWFAVGANWRGLEYGQNFGANVWWPMGNGISLHPNYADYNLTLARNAGVKVIRMGVGEDGRVLLAPNAEVAGYTKTFKADVKKLLDLANKHNMRVEFTLVDYLIAAPAEMVGGVQLRGRPEVISDTAVRTAYINDFLKPFVKSIRAHPAFMSIDIINEPEWLVANGEGGGWEDVSDPSLRPVVPLPLEDIRSFVNDCANAIKACNRKALVTVGISSKFAPLLEGLDLDYYALHHYPVFGELGQYLISVPSNKPWTLQEYPTNNTPASPSEYLDMVKTLCGCGASFWNLKPGCDEYTYSLSEREDKLAEIRSWVTDHPTISGQ